jgi:hypothetical protein
VWREKDKKVEESLGEKIPSEERLAISKKRFGMQYQPGSP